MKYIFSACLLLLFLSVQGQDFTETLRLNNTSGGLVIADFNNDSFPDIIFPQRIPFQGSKRMVVELNAATDTLVFAEQEFTLPEEVFGTPAAADFDNDGDIDIIVSTLAEANLLLLLQNEDGSLMDTLLTLPGSVALEAADLNGDEFPDLVALNINDRAIITYLNVNGTEFNKQTIYDPGTTVSAFSVADVDDDGDLDVVAGTDTFNGESLVALKNDGTGIFTKEVIDDGASGTVRSIDDITIGDLNGDDRLDVIVVARSNFIYAFYQQEDGAYNSVQVASTGNFFRSVAIGDFNGDRANDLVVGDNSGAGVRLLTSDGATEPNFTSSDIFGLTPVFRLVTQDLNRDGDLDLVASNGDVYVFENIIPRVPPVSVYSAQLREVNVFPNPVGEDDLFVRQAAELFGSRYQISDMNGRTIRKGELRTNGRIDTRGIVRGSYLLQIFKDDVLWARTMVVKQ